MASQVFYRKWRPQTLAELAGQTHVTQTLLNALKNGNISHAYLFCGPRGTGKTSTARILAKAINCLDNNGKNEPCNTCEMCRAITEDRALDVIEIDAASNRSIDDIRDLREKVNYAPAQARRKVYIIDEFHMLTKEASNALLKTLEEPPPHVTFILATTEAHKVLPTILSRCQHFDFHRLSRVDVIAQLNKICTAEKIFIEPQSLQLIARNTTGSLRDAENLLEQLITYYGHNIQFPQVQAMLGITGDYRAKEIVKHILNCDLTAGMSTLNSVNNDGLDLRQFNREIVEHLRSLLLVKTGAVDAVDLTADDITDLKTLAEQVSLSRVLNAIKLFGQIELNNNNTSTLPLELALVDCYLFSQSPAVKGKSEIPAASAMKDTVSQYTPVPSKPLSPQPEIKLPQPKPVLPQPEIKLPQPKPVLPQPEIKLPQPEPVSAKPESVSPAAAGAVPEITLDKIPPPAPAPVSDAPLATPSLSSEIERLRFNWKPILENIPPNLKKSNAVALLRSGGIKPVSIENDVVVLSLKYSIHKDNLEKPEYKQVTEKIISDFLGRPCKIRCICESDNNHLVKSAIKLGAQVTSVEEK